MAKQLSLGPVRSIAVSLATCASLGCSAKVVDLGNNPTGQVGSTSPYYSAGLFWDNSPDASDAGVTAFRVVDKETGSTETNPLNGNCAGIPCGRALAGHSFALASGRLFWGSRSYPASGTRSSILSCVVDYCASSLVTHFVSEDYYEVSPGGQAFETDNQTARGSIYWHDWGSSRPYMFSPIDGHSAATQISAPNAFYNNFAVDDGILYSATYDGTLLSCATSDCSNTLVRFALTPPAGEDFLNLSNSGVTNGPPAPTPNWYDGCAFIAVVPK